MSDTTPPDNNTITPQDPPPDKADDKGNEDKGDDKAPDLAAQLAALQETVKALTAKNAHAEAAAEEARRSALSEAERLAEDRKAVEAEKASLAKAKRDTHLDKLNVLPTYRDLVPSDLDAAGIEAWVRARPEIVQKKEGQQSGDFKPADKSPLAKFLAGESQHPIFSRETIRKMLGS